MKYFFFIHYYGVPVTCGASDRAIAQLMWDALAGRPGVFILSSRIEG